MMDGVVLEIALADEQATERFGEDVAAVLRPGDVIGLKGDLGAGKTTLARAIIRALAADPELEVPSPTFTLVQCYQARLPVYHFDLYRLGSPEELDEVGFDEAECNGVVILEWPERSGDRLPEQVVMIELSHRDAGRRAAMTGPAAAIDRLRRSLAVRGFLESAGWGRANRAFLLGDASTRVYETVQRNGDRARILMDAPRLPDGPPVAGGKPYRQMAHLAESVVPFVAIDKILRQRGFAAPEIYAQDLDQGFLLIEHVGRDGFLDKGHPVAERYAAAAALLATIHTQEWPRRLVAAPGVVHELPTYDRGAMMIEVGLLVDWYLPWATGKPLTQADRSAFCATWDAVLDRLRDAEVSLVLRDFHSPNIIWREDRTGHARLGLIDFQDALMGPSAYDMASLAQDARATIPRALQDATVEAYCRARMASQKPFDRIAFDEAYAIMAAQRASKILGIFVRLDQRDGKSQYLKHLPRISRYAARALEHPALEPVRTFYREHDLLERAAA
jgi:tRNA threonylcarbamoyl adenosine modification protein YjeE